MSKTEPKRGRPKKHRKSSAFRYVKMISIPDSSAGTINKKVAASVDAESRVKTDAWRGFNKMKEVVDRHIRGRLTKRKLVYVNRKKDTNWLFLPKAPKM